MRNIPKISSRVDSLYRLVDKLERFVISVVVEFVLELIASMNSEKI